MKEINELNRRLLEGAKEHLPEEGLMFQREDAPEEFERLPIEWRDEINAVREKLHQVMPDDFGYTLYVGDGEPSLTVEYENGPMAGAFRPHEWIDGVSILDQLREFDWDAERSWAIRGSELFDVIADRAKEMPTRIPSTKKLQKLCQDEVKDFIKDARKDASKVHVLFWQGDEGRTEEFADLKAFEHDLPNRMTNECHIIAVVANGKPLKVKRVDAMKQAALKELEDMPISHAKASGKHDLIVSGMFGGE